MRALRRRRDPETARPLKALTRELDLGGLANWGDQHSQAATVLADALMENGFRSIGNDLSRFSKRMQKWRDDSIKERGWVSWNFPGLPKYEQWRSIYERIEEAVRQIERKRPSEREWHQRRPHMAIIALRPVSQSEPILWGPFRITPKDTEDILTVRKWLAKHGVRALGKLRKQWQSRSDTSTDYGYVELHRNQKGDQLTIYPQKGWEAITIELGRSRPHLAARNIVAMTAILKRENYLHPALYARRIHRSSSMGPVELEENLRRVSTPTPTGVSLDERFGLKRTTSRGDPSITRRKAKRKRLTRKPSSGRFVKRYQ